MAERRGQHVHAAGRVETFEIADFAFAEDEDAGRLEVGVEAGERKAGLLDVRARDGTFEAGGAAEELEPKTDRFGPALEQARNRDRSRGHPASGSISPRLPSARRNSTLICSV